MSPKVSVVVPMYGVEKYLPACIDSLVRQTLQDIEIILVDDGSPDRCGKIAERYAAADSRIRVIHQENRGLGPARNTGMQAARGEYIGFVDSDDQAGETMLEGLYRAAAHRQGDIAVGGHCDWAKGRIVRRKRHPLAGKTVTDRAQINEIRKNLYGRGIADRETEAFPMSVWIALYKRSMIRDHGLLFQNTISEDVLFNISAYKAASCITFTGDTEYIYRTEGQPSIMRSFSQAKLKQYEDYLMRLTRAASEEEDPECRMRAKRAAINCCRLYVGQLAGSALPLQEKRRLAQAFATSPVVQACWQGYPVDTLPLQQRVFQKAMQAGRYGAALGLVRLREIAKKTAGRYRPA